VLRAIDVAREITGSDQVNALGFCIGGTLLASALAVRAARDEHPVASMTLLTTMLDYSDTGDIGLLVTPEGMAARELAIGKGGLLKGSELAQVFASLRANDLIWPYVVNGYLKGKPPPPFDILYWNMDNPNLPGPMFCWYIRASYLENRLCRPGGTVQLGETIDLHEISAPTFLYASKEDHIVPWKSAYACTQMFGGDTTFVLGASGHIAGVINPASKNKRSYWTGGTQGTDADEWLASARSMPGSWWIHWMGWLQPHAGKTVPARKKLGNATHKPIEPAPGRYVKVRAD
jgi:polyhydroxyalkanoate synthase